jgi:hypothetical protein
MKPGLSWVAIPFLTVALWGVGIAAENPPAKNPPAAGEKKAAPEKAKKPGSQKFQGAITALDAKAGTVSVKSDASEKNFTTQDAAKDAIERLTVGDRVKVVNSEKEGKLVATSVRRLKVKNADSTKSSKDSTNPSKPPVKEDAKSTTK